MTKTWILEINGQDSKIQKWSTNLSLTHSKTKTTNESDMKIEQKRPQIIFKTQVGKTKKKQRRILANADN